MKQALRVGVGMIRKGGYLTYCSLDGDCSSLWENAVFNDDDVHRVLVDFLYDRTDDIIREYNRL